MKCWSYDTLISISRQMTDAYTAGYHQIYDGKPQDRPQHRELAKAYDMGSEAARRDLQAENERIG